MAPWSLFYGSFFAIYGLWVTFGPARLLQSAPHWAALSLSLSSLVYFIALPLAQWTWQRIGFGRALGVWAMLTAVSYGSPAFWPALLPLALPCGSLAAAGAYGITETYMIEALTALGRSQDFGPVRKWGSLGFLLAAACGGVALDAMGGVQALEQLLALSALGFALSCAWLIRHQQAGSLQVDHPAAISAPDINEVEPVAHSAEGHPVGATPPAAGAVTLPIGVVAVAVAAIVLHRVAENQTTAWFGAMWIARGHSASEAGLLSAWAVAAEFLAMGASSNWIERRDLGRLMLVCSLVSAVRWAVTPLCQDFACAAALQSVHALSFGLFYPASLLWLRAHRPQDFFRARYVMEGSSRGLASGYYYLAASALIPWQGYPAIFAGCGLMALVAALLWLRVPARPRLAPV